MGAHAEPPPVSNTTTVSGCDHPGAQAHKTLHADEIIRAQITKAASGEWQKEGLKLNQTKPNIRKTKIRYSRKGVNTITHIPA